MSATPCLGTLIAKAVVVANAMASAIVNPWLSL